MTERTATTVAKASALPPNLWAILLLAALLFLGLVIIYPFIPAILLALIFSVATWPAYKWIKARLHQRNILASLLMAFGLTTFFVLPLILLGHNMADNLVSLSSQMGSSGEMSKQNVPEWLGQLPLVGSTFQKYWMNYANDTQYLETAFKNNIGTISELLLALGATIGRGVIDLLLAFFFSFFLFLQGDEYVRSLRVLMNKYIGAHSLPLLEVSRSTMVSIVYGLLGTALAQATIAGLGFWIAGVPAPVLLALLIFVLSPVPAGPPFVWIPVAIWLQMQGHTGMAVFMFLWGLIAISSIDNVLRPYLISYGSKLPWLLTFIGVLGGAFTFGFIGLFIGPTILAIIYDILAQETQLVRPVKKLK